MSGSDARDQEPVTITDKRKIDPDTGTARNGEAGSAADAPLEGDVVDPAPAAGGDDAGTEDGAAADEPEDQDARARELEAQLAERTADLQRLQAEFANYRRRVERDRAAEKSAAKATVVGELLGVLDDLARARAHGDLESGPLRSVADKLQAVLEGQGLAAFGSEGDPFDPSLHEAVQHEGSSSEPVVGTVLRQGYTFGDKVLRHAMVAVVDSDTAEGDNDDAAPGGSPDAE
ncbi:nucleotide exchange factor GrpE [Lolliginicoccus suaedae]|uniref:nucleotide exchange factor GrpE n=1 Tax=Lolliginicoccus suaedae TaxID=2605429 RepID=UPI0011EF44A2|nr:nucleotide exchange factor GrpE [Lolliginicoccus suaedae]